MKSKRAVYLALFLLIVVLIVAYFGTSFLSSSAGKFYLNNPLFHVLFAFILIVLTLLFILFIRNLALFLFPQFKTNLKIKIFTAFILLILGPALFSIFFASGTINRGLDRLLKIQVSRIVETSYSAISEFLKYLEEDLEKKLELLSKEETLHPDIPEIYSIDGFLKVSGKDYIKVGSLPLSREEAERLRGNKKYFFLDRETRLVVLCKEHSKGTVLCASKRIPEPLFQKIIEIDNLHSDYKSLVAYKTPIKAVYTITFIFMGLALLFGALWFAKYFERRISIPVEALYRATQRIGKGELNVKIPEEEGMYELRHVISAFNDMVEQLRTLKKNLEDNKRYLEEVLNSISAAIITFDNSGRVISCNREAKRLLGVSESDRGCSIWELLSKYPSILKTLRELNEIGRGRAEVREEIDGREKFLTVELLSSPHIEDRILIIEDVSELVRAKKEEAWREVARRIAHEIKNPLTPITLNAERIRKQLKKKNPKIEEIVEKAVESILEEVEVIRRLIEEFRKFSRLPLPEKRLTDLNGLVRSVLESYRDKINIHYELDDIPKIPLDRGLFREVLINLVKNSIDAGAENLWVSTTSKDGRVFLVVKDDGPGIPEEIMDKLFNPYVSTKEEGWGLGLSIVKKIVEDHGGRIYTVDRNTFVIELPL